ncbi:hypothetical protein BLAHAN_05404 [Blautia hansenii DSM 20583]|uniref:Uncharacterized protein n=1 Tax=Blautia hansenii DSM 20583 TaxID=537007 RepID=C9L7N3_BLAHA|nr:hypothetical protein BLAHAN_05404 [Blautia hansenii DSM 20583]
MFKVVIISPFCHLYGVTCQLFIIIVTVLLALENSRFFNCFPALKGLYRQ